MKEKFAKGVDAKQVVAKMKEASRLEMLEEIKKLGGPFTNASEVSDYLKTSNVNAKEKKKRF